MDPPRVDRYRLAFLIGVPLAWAVLLLFHPNPGDDIYGALRDEATLWLAVHVATLLFIGLLGAALFMMTRHLAGVAARVSWLAIGAFVLLYGAGEAINGVAVGVLVEHANDLPADERGGTADAIQALWESALVDDLIIIGSVGWVVAVLAAAVAYRRVRAPLAVSVLLAASAIVILHGPPIGPIGLLCFAGAVTVLALSQRRRDESPESGAGARRSRGSEAPSHDNA